MLFTLRVSLPDRPGSLGALASSLGHGGANIVSLEVVERDDGIAVDELTVKAPSGLREALRAATANVPGILIEDVRPADMFLHLSSPLELAETMVACPPGKVLSTLVKDLAGAVWADWVAIVDGSDPPQVLQRSAAAPTFEGLRTPWMPLDGPRRLSAGDWMPSAWTMPALVARQGLPELAVAPLTGGTVLMAGRDKGPRFRATELEQMNLLAQIAVRLASRVPVRKSVEQG